MKFTDKQIVALLKGKLDEYMENYQFSSYDYDGDARENPEVLLKFEYEGEPYTAVLNVAALAKAWETSSGSRDLEPTQHEYRSWSVELICVYDKDDEEVFMRENMFDLDDSVSY